MTIRYAKITIILVLAAFAFMVAFNNITDYGSNFAFVRHVLSMDTLFPNNNAMYRAITTPWIWHAAYWLIIAGETLTAGLLTYGALALWRSRHGTGMAFGHAKKWAIAGLAAGFLVWFFGFMVVGGEWFMMWQSVDWNGQESAFRFIVCIGIVLIVVLQDDKPLI